MSRPGSVLAVGFTLAVSLAANVTWAARDGDPVTIAAGIVTPVLLVMAVHQWRSHLDAAGWRRVLRLVAMTGVTGTAAAWTWVHTTRLLLAHQIETPLAVAAPLAVDGLAVMATMALWPAASRAVTLPVPMTVIHLAPQTDPVSGRHELDEPAERPVLAGAPPRFEDMNRSELRAACREAGVSQQGTVTEMRDRLAATVTEAVTPT